MQQAFELARPKSFEAATVGNFATAYDEATGSDRLKRKGVLATQIDLPDAGPSWIVVTHLQASDHGLAFGFRNQRSETQFSRLQPCFDFRADTSDFRSFFECCLTLFRTQRWWQCGHAFLLSAPAAKYRQRIEVRNRFRILLE